VTTRRGAGGRFARVEIRAVLCVLAVLSVLAGCGDDDEASESPPAAAERSSEAAGGAEPGAPDPGEPAYTGLGSWWVKLDGDARLSSAAEFIGANSDDCAGVDAADLERQTRIAYGLDFPLTTTVSEVMLETCALILDGR
jgi:hypothetical protein